MDCDSNVEMFSLRPKLSDPQQLRSTNILFLSDSGSNIYNIDNPKSFKRAGQYLVNTDKLRVIWRALISITGSGTEWKGWIPVLQKIIASTTSATTTSWSSARTTSSVPRPTTS